MKVIDAIWTPEFNLLVILCDCGSGFTHPVNRWKVMCPICGTTNNISELRKVK